MSGDGDIKFVSSHERKSQDLLKPKISLRSVEDIGKHFPGVVCKSDYPPTVSFFGVPFKLMSEIPIRRKPYSLSRNKQEFV